MNRNFETVGRLLEKTIKMFNHAKVSEPVLSAKHILCHTLKVKQMTCLNRLNHVRLSPTQIRKYDHLCSRRLNGLPVQYVIGEWDFCDSTLQMRRPVFIPRPETEELVGLVARKIDSMKDLKNVVNVLDGGCGSGCISLQLLKSSSLVKCVSVDKSRAACELTKENAKLLSVDDRIEIRNLQLENGRIDGIECRAFDIIVSNPPYIPSSEIIHLQSEVIRFEDRDALDGGTDGLDVVRDLINLSSRMLSSDGSLFMEVGLGQTEIIEEFISRETNKFKCKIYKDFTNRDRFIEIWR